MAPCQLLKALCLCTSAAGVFAASRDMQDRLSLGECADEPPAEGGTYYDPENQAEETLRSDATAAELFDLAYSSSFKVLTSHFSKEQYVLTQCGQETPTNAEVEAVVPLESGYGRKHFSVPVQNAIALSTVHLAFLDALGVQDRTDYVDQWASAPCWQKAIECGATLESEWGGNATLRAKQLASADVIFMTCSTSGDGCTNVHDVDAGVHVPTSQDAGLLQSAEYVKFIAAFFNLEPRANELFDAMKTSYEAAAVEVSERPTVAWVRYDAPSDWGAEKFVVLQATYRLELTTAAGAENFDAATAFAGVNGVLVEDAVAGTPASGKVYTLPVSGFGDSKTTTAQALATALADVDVIVDETYAPVPSSYTFEGFLENYDLTDSSSLKFVQNKMVLRVDGTLSASNGLDWFESRLARPDWAVEGMARTLHGDDSKRHKYFRNIGADEEPQVLDADMCPKTLPVCDAMQKPEIIEPLGTGLAKEVDGTMGALPGWWFLGLAVLAAFAFPVPVGSA